MVDDIENNEEMVDLIYPFCGAHLVTIESQSQGHQAKNTLNHEQQILVRDLKLKDRELSKGYNKNLGNSSLQAFSHYLKFLLSMQATCKPLKQDAQQQ